MGKKTEIMVKLDVWDKYTELRFVRGFGLRLKRDSDKFPSDISIQSAVYEAVQKWEMKMQGRAYQYYVVSFSFYYYDENGFRNTYYSERYKTQKGKNL